MNVKPEPDPNVEPYVDWRLEAENMAVERDEACADRAAMKAELAHIRESGRALAAAAELIWEAITFGNIHRVSNQAAALRNALNAYNGASPYAFPADA